VGISAESAFNAFERETHSLDAVSCNHSFEARHSRDAVMIGL
jgi:hypothetical protein